MKKTNWLLLVLALVLSMFLAACSGGGDEGSSSSGDSGSDSSGDASGDSKQVLNIMDSAEIPTMDASLATDAVAFQFLGSTMDGLYRLGENAQPEPGIAEESEVSDDGMTWTFHLRDAKWSNGDPVTANDFVYAWQRAVNPDTGSEYGPYMMGGVIKNATAISNGEKPVDQLGVEAVDEHTFKVTLEKPIPYFKSLTTFGTFLPLNKKFVEEKGDKYALEADTLLSNGPFKITEWNHGEGWTLKKNEDYWDADNVKLNQINVKVVKDTATGVNLYETGEVDRVNLSAEFVDQYRSSDDFKVEEEPTLFYLKLNQKANDVLGNVKARKAMQMVIDRQSMVDVILNNGSIPADGDIPKNFVKDPESGKDFREVNGELVSYDVDKAKQLWNEAKEELGKDKITLEYLGGDTETAKNLDAYIKDQLEQLDGLTVKVTSVPFKERLQRDTNMNYQIQNAGWGPDYIDPNTFLNMWVTDGANNKTGYSSKEYDQLIEQAGNEYALEPEKRFENFYKAEKMLIQDDAVLVPLYQRARAQLWKPYVKDVQVNPMGPDYSYKHAYIEGK
ncbi:peptide ABC transporter substrate-binding protein [Halobacillus salinarum]|uniref:Peptide ABC transporter substrate-binding protein n=1 Tax=Halobacillus salinarum TaxID=2932257 RepID=A0ABY4EMV0_9BACI|nr:peptide ABC transporter substrate-binding protein [Halobacillus salinarum]UOQ43436.1 peptide ABC transporter substrate-binding protein [Halobacillus salinarum]